MEFSTNLPIETLMHNTPYLVIIYWNRVR